MKKSVVLLMASLAVLTACGQQSHSGKAGSNQSVQSKAKGTRARSNDDLDSYLRGQEV